MEGTMRLGHLATATAAIVAFGATVVVGISSPDNSVAQQITLRDQLAGSWNLVSIDQVASDGTKAPLLGPNPKGLLILSRDGRSTQVYVQADRLKFAIENRLKGTPEENTAALRGTIASFGTWSVDEVNKTLTLHIEGSIFPNQDGTQSKREVSISGDNLKLFVLAGASGARAENLYTRVK
jgi:hypothetical protein